MIKKTNRKFIQLATAPETCRKPAELVALANDGTVWRYGIHDDWEQIVDLDDIDAGWDSCFRCPKCNEVNPSVHNMGPNGEDGFKCCGEDHYEPKEEQ